MWRAEPPPPRRMVASEMPRNLRTKEQRKINVR